MANPSRGSRKKIVSGGASAVGAAAIAATGVSLGNSALIIGAAGGIQLMSLVADEVLSRKITRSESRRVAEAHSYARQHIQDRLSNGHNPRQDGFFDTLPSGRHAARELYEGVLATAQRQWEERKVKHLGYLMANIGFTPDVDSSTANSLIHLAERLSWRQYVLLALVADNETAPLPNVGTLGQPTRAEWSAWSVRHELSELFIPYDLIGARTDIYGQGQSVPDVTLPSQRLRNGGVLLHTLMELGAISEDDRTEVRDQLA